jgi:Fe2+ or Zn2+ uptake regulation protein
VPNQETTASSAGADAALNAPDGADAKADAASFAVNAAIAAALACLREAGLRITAPRRAMLRFLATAAAPVSAEDIHHALGGVADLVTVYRSIEAFEKVGVARRHPLESGKSLWCLETVGHAHHHHVTCRKCGRADELSGCEAEKFETAARRLGYKEISHVFEIYGVCGDCTGREKRTGEKRGESRRESRRELRGELRRGCKHGKLHHKEKKKPKEKSEEHP